MTGQDPLMKIYTRTGDDGTTALFGGRRVSKSDLRIEAYGTIDELNASLGLASASAPGDLLAPLGQIQNDLFTLGSHLATPAGSPAAKQLPRMSGQMVTALERQIDAAEGELEPLRQFILPAGSEAAARLHVARTICRRAERLAVALHASEPIEALVIEYLNRLSDWLFVMARLANHRAGVADVPWQKPAGSQ
jgi:cob(I)alamin adenosyltransferase